MTTQEQFISSIGEDRDIYHPLLLPDVEARAAMRAALPATRLSFEAASRAIFDDIMEHTPDAPGVSYEQATVGGVPGCWCRPEQAWSGAVLLYLHGGAFVLGSAWAVRHLAGQLAARAGVAAFVPGYRLAPEQPFPAAVDDVLAAYRGLAALEYSEIALAGDSAGGGLALVTLSQATRAADRGEGPRPVGAAVLSPWTDLTLTGESLKTHADTDPLVSLQTLGAAVPLYLNGHDPQDPLVSPLYGDLTGLPPVLVHVGEDEVLLSDSTRYIERLRAAGGVGQLHVWAGMAHVFPASVGAFVASAAALDDLGQFLFQQLQAARGTGQK
jgi:monoterpene epsilon-lactone hydrolase